MDLWKLCGLLLGELGPCSEELSLRNSLGDVCLISGCLLVIYAELSSLTVNFWINLPVSGATFILLVIFLDVHNPQTKLREGFKAIDWFGSVSILGLVLMLLLGLDFGGKTFPWDSPQVICLIVFGSLMSIFFIYSEKRLAQYPLMPLGLFMNRSNAACLLLALWHGMVISRCSNCTHVLTLADLHWCRILPAALLPSSERVFTLDLRPAHHANYYD